MDANELVNVAYEAISGIDLTAHDRGQIYGVMQMALRTLEAQHASLLAEADEEAAEAKRLLAEAQQQRDEVRRGNQEVYGPDSFLVSRKELDKALKERDAALKQLPEHIAKIAAGGGIQAALGKMTLERDAWKSEAGELQKRIDNLNAENARLHRSLEERMTAHIPGAVQVAKTEELHGMAKVYLVPARSEDL